MADIFQKAKQSISRQFIEAKFGVPGSYWQGDNFFTLSPLPGRNDRTIGSFSIRIDGVFSDFACPEDTGDIITLISRVEGKTPFEVAKELAGETDSPPARGESRSEPADSALEISWMPIPEGKQPAFRTPPDYLTLFHIDGAPAFFVARFNTGGDNGKKLIYPIYWTGSQFVRGLPKSLTVRPLFQFEKGKTVVIVEGEGKMHDATMKYPQYAWTTWHGGAGAFKKIDLSLLKGCDVIVWPDNDEPGAKAMDHICNHLAGVVRSLRRVEIPEQKPKAWDVGDAIKEGFPVLQLLEESVIIDTTPPEVIPEETITEPRPAAERAFTDLGNAERFTDMWGHILRYNIEKNKWMVWHGGRWKDNDQTIITPMVKRTIRTMAEDDSRNEAIFWARKSESSKSITSMLNLAQRERGIPVNEEMLDRDPYLLNCPNGTVDLKTGELMEPNPEWLCTKTTRANYNPKAQCPRFLRFLDETFEEDPGLLNFIQRWVGYSLTGDVSAQTFAVFYGVGANGKSTLVETIQKLAGDYVRTAPPDTFIQKQSGGIPNDIAALRGARMVLTTETEANAKLAEAKVKSMTGGDRISARYMRGEFFEFTPTWKITISTNHRPRISGGDYGIWRRIVLVPFNNVLTPEKQNPRLQEDLLEESEGILRWAVQGAVMWYNDHGGRLGLQVPKAVYAETQEYREDEDVLGRFISTACLTQEEILKKISSRQIADSELSASQVYYSFKWWAEQQGETFLAKVTQSAFGRMMRERGYIPGRNARGKYYTGIIPYEIRNAPGEYGPVPGYKGDRDED